MTTDNIQEIGIDDTERLYIIPEHEKFTLIYRSAAEVHWDSNRRCLYSPKPREWSYYDWYRHIITVVEDEYACKLLLSKNTRFIDIHESLKNQITDIYTPS